MTGTSIDLQPHRPVGELLRQWRARRRLSQLQLAGQAGISTRHLSFLETGRSRPSRNMVLRLAQELELPPRECNGLLLAAGYAPVYPETALDAPQMSPVRTALRQLLSGHEPCPALVVDRRWNLVEANVSLGLLTAGSAPALLAPPVNVLRLALHPAGMAPRIVNAGEWRARLLGRLRRQVAVTADPALSHLLDELRTYPCHQPEPELEPPGVGDLAVPLRIRDGDRELAFYCTVATFGTPLDVTLAELVIELFLPANPETASLLHRVPVAVAGDRGLAS